MKTVPSIISRFLSPLSFGEGLGVRLLALLFLASCGEQTELEQPVVADGETVEVTKEIQINLLPIQTMGAGTRAGEDKPEKGEAIHVSFDNDAATRVQENTGSMTAAESTIKNAYIVQFNGTEPTATAAWVSSDIKSQLGGSASITCSFSMAAGKKNRVYVVANCASAPTLGMTLADFEAPVAFTPVTSLAAGTLPYSACQDLGVGDVFDVFQLKSVLAKLTFTCETAGATLKLMNLPSGYSFYTQAPGDNTVRPTGMTYTSTADLTSGTTYYVPENLSGRRNISSPIVRISNFAPTNSMYVQIAANSTTYNIYLGDGTSQDFNFTGGYSYNINSTIYGKDAADLRVGKPPYFEDLSIGGTANCYLVDKYATWYLFDGTVMGNGAITPLPEKVSYFSRSAAIIPETLDPRSADVLWETWNTTTTPTAGSVVSAAYVVNGGILIRTGNKKGNAVVAARDASGSIIWSWHIWAANSASCSSKKLAPIADDSGTFTVDDLEIMDRNLGALSVTSGDVLSCGLLYQWGRKDPFPGTADFQTQLSMATTGSFLLAKNDVLVTVTDAKQNPCTFYEPFSKEDWTFRNDNLWGDPKTMNTVVFTTNDNNADYMQLPINKDQNRKTIYDPCPRGWKVPPAYTFANVTKPSSAFSNGFDLPIGVGGSTIWFPMAGAVYSSTFPGKNTNRWAGYWTSHRDETLGEMYGYSNMLRFDYMKVLNFTQGIRQEAYSVRCMMEKKFY